MQGTGFDPLVRDCSEEFLGKKKKNTAGSHPTHRLTGTPKSNAKGPLFKEEERFYGFML